MRPRAVNINKPDRSPDMIVPPGHAVWWDEMIFMHVYNMIYKLEIKQDTGKLCAYRYISTDGERSYVYLPPLVQESYDKWWYETFESKFIGTE